MATNISKLIKALQEKISAANTTNTTSQDLIYMIELAKFIDGGSTIESYADKNSLPDASTSSSIIAFNEDDNKLYVKVDGKWIRSAEYSIRKAP